MAHKVTAVLSPKPGQGATLEVPQEVKDEIDGLYDHLRTHEGTEGFAEFDSKAERNKWLNQSRAYCRSREAGALKFRQLPSKHLPDTQVRFMLTADLPENGAREGNK